MSDSEKVGKLYRLRESDDLSRPLYKPLQEGHRVERVPMTEAEMAEEARKPPLITPDLAVSQVRRFLRRVRGGANE